MKHVADAIEQALPERRPLGHHEAYINGKESRYVATCLAGSITDEKWANGFAEKLAQYCGVAHAVPLSSGTAALQLAVQATGILPGEEVLVPSLTFAATANAVIHAGCIPNFVDGGFGTNYFKLRCYLERTTKPNPEGRGRLNTKTGRLVTGLIAVDLLGFPANYVQLEPLAKEYGLILIEDAAEALGTSLGNRKCGAFGHVAALSFNNNKIVTTNGGGALLTNSPWVAAKAWSLSTTARVPHKYRVEHSEVAYNFRMPAINAALGWAQMEQLDFFLRTKRVINNKYAYAVKDIPEVTVRGAGDGGEGTYGFPNFWLSTLMLTHKVPAPFAKHRDELLDELHARGIQARALFTPLHKLPMYRDCPRDTMGYADDVFNRAICLPSGVGLLS